MKHPNWKRYEYAEATIVFTIMLVVVAIWFVGLKVVMEFLWERFVYWSLWWMGF